MRERFAGVEVTVAVGTNGLEQAATFSTDWYPVAMIHRDWR